MASPSGEPQASNTEAQRERNTALDEVFVLSLPGFVWRRANYPAAISRVNHACSVAGNRQMIVTGGLNPASANQSELIYSRDVWTQGIGVFDLTTLQWKDSYDANAEPYTSPDPVKSWYAANGLYPKVWDDPAVEGFFTQSSASSAGSSNGQGGSGDGDLGDGNLDQGDSSKGNLGAPSAEDDSGSSDLNAGAVAGGVIGGVVGLALIATLFWFLRRSRQRPSKPGPGSTSGTEEMAEVHGNSSHVEGGDSNATDSLGSKAELSGSIPPPAYANKNKPLPELEQPLSLSSEVAASPPRHEMP